MEGRVVGWTLARRSTICLFLTAAAVLAPAPPAAAQDTQEQKAIGALMDVFGEFCLKRFPNGAAVQTYVAAQGIAAMPETRLRHILGSDPGAGWLQTNAFGEYSLTIEQPPYHTCAGRKQFPRVPDVRTAYAARLKSWVASLAGATMTEQPPESPTIDGIVSRAFIFPVAVPGVAKNEMLLAVVTPFDDGRAEVRLARAIGNR